MFDPRCPTMDETRHRRRQAKHQQPQEARTPSAHHSPTYQTVRRDNNDFKATETRKTSTGNSNAGSVSRAGVLREPSRARNRRSRDNSRFRRCGHSEDGGCSNAAKPGRRTDLCLPGNGERDAGRVLGRRQLRTGVQKLLEP